MKNFTIRELADEMNETFDTGVEHLATCKENHEHKPVTQDVALFFYAAYVAGLSLGKVSKKVAVEAANLSLDEMKAKHKFIKYE